ncbi:MAG: methylenetetrahydrofolate reductase [NAD(P)H] [Thermodesulfobacteriota bacterium]|nr:methylenetetrahydrofolate reductase [NAD(P)H] [Thermodesulfobacteriota bacterium]
MRIAELIAKSNKFISLEFFPPKERASWPGFFETVARLTSLDPLFVSVTYGAGGGTQDNTLEIVRRLKKDFELEPMAHLTCVGASGERLHDFLRALESFGVDNVLALRGDPPRGVENFKPDSDEFKHASDLVAFIRGQYPDMGIGVAGYPEGHPQAPSIKRDFEFLKLKLDKGADFAITQLFFDNRLYWDFAERLSDMGVDKPLIPGVLPIMSLGSVKRILSFCGASLPGNFFLALEAAYDKGGDEAVRGVGLEHARNQVRGLLDGGAPGVHLYTLNKADACLEIVDAL